MFYNTDVAGKAGVLASNGQLQEVSSPQEFLAMAREMQKVTKAHGLSFGYLPADRRCGDCSTRSTSSTARTWNSRPGSR